MQVPVNPSERTLEQACKVYKPVEIVFLPSFFVVKKEGQCLLTGISIYSGCFGAAKPPQNTLIFW